MPYVFMDHSVWFPSVDAFEQGGLPALGLISGIVGGAVSSIRMMEIHV